VTGTLLLVYANGRPVKSAGYTRGTPLGTVSGRYTLDLYANGADVRAWFAESVQRKSQGIIVELAGLELTSQTAQIHFLEQRKRLLPRL
jgi:hypothetical protein